MDHKKIKQLVEEYLDGETSLKEEKQLHAYFSGGNIADELQSYADQFNYQNEAKNIEPDAGFDPFGKINFADKDVPVAAAQMHSVKSRVMFDPDRHSRTNKFTRWSLRIAAGFILLIIGYTAGQLLDDNDEYASTQQVAQLQEEVQQMKGALMNTGNYQPASAGERLSAVNASTRLPAENNELDQQITDILVYTMNNDKSVNVRIAAAEALFRFREDAEIKSALINGLSEQDDPLMQILLIDMLVELNAKDAVSEMKKLLVHSDTQDVVRERLQAGIAELKV